MNVRIDDPGTLGCDLVVGGVAAITYYGAPAIVLGVPVRYIHTPACIAAAADYEATVITGHPFAFKDIWPDANMLFANSYIFKEYLGYWGYRLFRR